MRVLGRVAGIAAIALGTTALAGCVAPPPPPPPVAAVTPDEALPAPPPAVGMAAPYQTPAYPAGPTATVAPESDDVSAPRRRNRTRPPRIRPRATRRSQARRRPRWSRPAPIMRRRNMGLRPRLPRRRAAPGRQSSSLPTRRRRHASRPRCQPPRHWRCGNRGIGAGTGRSTPGYPGIMSNARRQPPIGYQAIGSRGRPAGRGPTAIGADASVS